MILIIGGTGQGKQSYVLQKTGLSPTQVATTVAEAAEKPILYGLQNCIRTALIKNIAIEEQLNDLLQKNPKLIVICDEVGAGIVPIAPQDRQWRETVGRICCELAKKAKRVERIFCGLPMVLKEEAPWN